MAMKCCVLQHCVNSDTDMVTLDLQKKKAIEVVSVVQ